MRLYCTVDGVPVELLPLTKERLGDDFAQLARSGWIARDNHGESSAYGASFHQVTDRGHWIEVIASIFKIGPSIVDHERCMAIAESAGFAAIVGLLCPASKKEGEQDSGGNGG
jgi:hypothetical protein